MAAWISLDGFDVALLAMAVTLVLCMWCAFAVYIVLHRRRMREGGQRYHRANKSDRPLWVGSTMLAGTVWLLSSLQVYGIALYYYDPNEDNRYVCVVQRYGLQYALGFVLWISAVMYRMLRTWMTQTLGKGRPWKPAALNAVLVVPSVLFALIAVGANDMMMTPVQSFQGICIEERPWVVTSLVLMLAYLALFAYLVACLARYWKYLGVMRLYYVACGLAFTFVAGDFAVRFWLDQGGYQRVYQQLLMLLVWLIVATYAFMLYDKIFGAPKMVETKEEADTTRLAVYTTHGLLLPQSKDDETPMSERLRAHVQFPLSVDPLDMAYVDTFDGDLSARAQKQLEEQPKQQKPSMWDKWLRLKEDRVTGEDDLEDDGDDGTEEDGKIAYIVPPTTWLFISPPQAEEGRLNILQDVLAQLPPADQERVEPRSSRDGAFAPPDEQKMSFTDELTLVKKYFQ